MTKHSKVAIQFLSDTDEGHRYGIYLRKKDLYFTSNLQVKMYRINPLSKCACPGNILLTF